MEGNHSQVESALEHSHPDLATGSCICSHKLPPIAIIKIITGAAPTFRGWLMSIIIHAKDRTNNGVSIHNHAARVCILSRILYQDHHHPTSNEEQRICQYARSAMPRFRLAIVAS